MGIIYTNTKQEDSIWDNYLGDFKVKRFVDFVGMDKRVRKRAKLQVKKSFMYHDFFNWYINGFIDRPLYKALTVILQYKFTDDIMFTTSGYQRTELQALRSILFTFKKYYKLSKYGLSFKTLRKIYKYLWVKTFNCVSYSNYFNLPKYE